MTLTMAINRHLTVCALRWLVKRKARRAPEYTPRPGSLLYVAASALPYHVSGYTNRTQEIIVALCSVGADVSVMTRPGYPWDRKDRVVDAGPDTTLVDGILYHHSRSPSNHRPVLQFALQAAPAIAQLAASRKAAAIHAASNHTNALPALLAARRLGIPFHYEMRGLWELSRISRSPDFEGSWAFRQGLALERLVASQADRLFVISEQLGKYIQQHWGIPAERMTLLPNCIDVDRVPAADPAQAVPLTIGYAGSLIVYEGLDTLLEAVARLKREGLAVRLHVVGHGEAGQALQEQARQLGVDDVVCFHGRASAVQARAIIGRCAVICIPRRPFEVCKIVPPLKLVEALAMARPVVVPDLPVFVDEMGSDPAGWFFKAGDSADLARTLRVALEDHAQLAAIGQRARTYAIQQRRWQGFVGAAVPGATPRASAGNMGAPHGR